MRHHHTSIRFNMIQYIHIIQSSEALLQKYKWHAFTVVSCLRMSTVYIPLPQASQYYFKQSKAAYRSKSSV